MGRRINIRKHIPNHLAEFMSHKRTNKTIQIKKALVIGISNYDLCPLKNPNNDATSMAEVLGNKGFHVTKEIDLTSSEFFDSIQNFCNDVDKSVDVILFYFAGHGLECNTKNYLLPLDYDVDNLDYDSPTLDYVYGCLKEISQTAITIIILDACRNDGNKDFLDVILNRGEVMGKKIHIGQTRPVIQDSNVFIAFSTAPGMKASDGVTDKNGLFTECLLESITKYGMSIDDLFRTVREKVITKSDYKQVPWTHSSLKEYYSFDNLDVPYHLVDTIHLPFDTLYSSQFTNDSSYVLLAGDGNEIILRNVKELSSKTIEIGDVGLHCEVVCVSDGYIFIADSDGCLSSFCLREDKREKNKIFESSFFALSVAHNEESVVACGDNGILKKISINNLSEINLMQLSGTRTIHCVRHLPSSSLNVLVCGDNYKLEIWDVDTSSKVTKLENDSFYTNVAEFSPDGKLLATGHENGVIKIWSVENLLAGKKIKPNRKIELAPHVENTIVVIEIKKDGGDIPTNHIVSLSFSFDSKILAIGTSDSSLVFVDVKYGETIKTLRLDYSISQVYSVSQSNTESLLVCSGHKRTAYVFSTSEKLYIDSQSPF